MIEAILHFLAQGLLIHRAWIRWIETAPFSALIGWTHLSVRASWSQQSLLPLVIVAQDSTLVFGVCEIAMTTAIKLELLLRLLLCGYIVVFHFLIVQEHRDMDQICFRSRRAHQHIVCLVLLVDHLWW